MTVGKSRLMMRSPIILCHHRFIDNISVRTIVTFLNLSLSASASSHWLAIWHDEPGFADKVRFGSGYWRHWYSTPCRYNDAWHTLTAHCDRSSATRYKSLFQKGKNITGKKCDRNRDKQYRLCMCVFFHYFFPLIQWYTRQCLIVRFVTTYWTIMYVWCIGIALIEWASRLRRR